MKIDTRSVLEEVGLRLAGEKAYCFEYDWC